MSRYEDLTGKIFGNLIVTQRAYYNSRRTFYRCTCVHCGKEKLVSSVDLKNHTINCCEELDKKVEE